MSQMKARTFIVLVASFCLCYSCTVDGYLENKIAGEALGTTYHITYLGEANEAIVDGIDSIIAEVNHSLSTYSSASFISAFNDNREFDPNYTDVKHFNYMVSLSNEISLATNGAFDPSASRLFSLYDRSKKDGVEMNRDEVENCLRHQGLRLLTLNEDRYEKNDSLFSLNFNAIAKGYLVDLLAEYFEVLGYERYMIEVGGEMRVKGNNKENQLWRVGVNIPDVDADPSSFYTVLELENVSVATSGNYQNYYYLDGELIGHTINPKTGKPVINTLKSASIIHDDCAVADAYATACMVLGTDSARDLVEENINLSAYLIYELDGKLVGEFVE
ncbi:MAG: FAD:protein FMN transferase [Bacteroidia bacterium]